MRRLWLMTAGLGLSCTMINPAFEDGAIADEAAGSDDSWVEDADSFDESGSGSGDGNLPESGSDEIESSDTKPDDAESMDVESTDAESTDAESSDTADADMTTDAPDTTGTETSDSESTDTEAMACNGIQPGNDCDACKIDACCHDTNWECFDPNNTDGCACVLECLNIGGLLNLCGLQCGVLDLLLGVADTTFDCVLQSCGQAC